MAELAYCVPLGIPHSRFLSWSEADQDKAIAYRQHVAKVCSGCGTRKEEWSDDRFAYVAQSERCPGCEVLAMEQANVPPDAKGVRLFLTPRSLADPPAEG